MPRVLTEWARWMKSKHGAVDGERHLKHLTPGEISGRWRARDRLGLTPNPQCTILVADRIVLFGRDGTHHRCRPEGHGAEEGFDIPNGIKEVAPTLAADQIEHVTA